MVAQTRHGGPTKKRLTFHEKLLPKGINTDALLKKLKTLHTQLASLDQDTVDTSSLNTARAELIHNSLLLHKDRGVKAYTACCLADILRLYAPEAPYTQAELRDIFQFFFRQLSAGLKGQDEDYYNEYFHLLESLSTVKSVVLVCDFPSAEEILQEIFRDLFTVVKRDLTKKVELFMADILVALIDESTSLPSEALDIMMSQFKDKNAKNDNPAYRLAVQVCNGAADKLQRYVCQYFGDILTSSTSDEDEQEEDIDSLRTAHDLIKQLQRACPTVLHSVIPILEAELRSENLNPRVIATQTLGEMYGEKTGQDLVRKYPTTWAAWLNRKADVAVPVRLKCLEAVPALFLSLPEQASALDDLLKTKFYDPDERVRAATCKLFSQLDYETTLHHISKERLDTLVGRGMDKKASVRKEALSSAGKIYSLAYPEIANNDHAAAQHFAWIPHEILVMASSGFELRALVEAVLADFILPLPSEKDIDESAWTERLLTVMRHLTTKSANLLVALSSLKANRPNIFEVFVETCVQNNGGIIDGNRDAIERKLKALIQHLSATFPDKVKAAEDLNSFAKLNESRLYKLLKTVMDPQTDLKGLVRATNEFHKRLEQVSSSLVPTMSIILRRCSYRVVNQSAVPFLLKHLTDAFAPNDEESNKKRRSTISSSRAQHAAVNSLTLLVTIAKNNAAMLRPHLGELTKILADDNVEDRRESIGLVNAGSNVEVALMALANLAKTKEGTGLAGASEKRINQRILKLALDSEWRQAKFATRYLTLSANKDEICADLVKKICAKINGEGRTEPIPVSYIAAVVQLVRFAPEAFEAESEVIMSHLVKRVIMTPIPNEDDGEDEWIENDELPDQLRAKILALKVCRYRTLSHASSEDALKMATPVLKMLATILEHDGSLSPDIEEDPKAKSRMRLQASISLLHLATVPVFATAIMPKFVRLACTIQDSCFDVRQHFLMKLIHLLQSRKLPASYNIIPFLTMLDPEQEIKLTAASYVDAQKRRMTPSQFLDQFELIFIRLLHLLAHHPDFATTQEELIDMAGYVNYYLEQVSTKENISLLYHLAEKGKSVRDPESHSRSEKFYIMCEIAQLLIRNRNQANSWLLPGYPGKVKLPSDILKPLPSAEAVNQILRTVYLSDEASGWLMEKYGGPKEKEKKEREKKERKERLPTKRKSAPTKSNGQAKRPRKRRSGSDDSGDDEPPATSDAGSDVEMEDGTTKARKTKQSREERLNARTKAKEQSSKKDDDDEDEEDEE